METLPVTLFRNTYEPFVELLDEYEVKYQVREVHPDVIMGAGETVEVILAVVNSAQFSVVCMTIAKVINTFLTRDRNRELNFTTKENQVINAKGKSLQEVAKMVEIAKNAIAFNPIIPKDNQDKEA